MTALLLQTRQAYAEGMLEVGAVATVQLLADLDGHAAQDWWQTQVPITVYGQFGLGGVPVTVPQAGHYRVSVALPRSADVVQQVRVDENEELPVQIDLIASPHEYLAWQQFSGAIRDHPYRSETGLADTVTATGRVGELLNVVRDRVNLRPAAALDLPTVSVATVAPGRDGWLEVGAPGASGHRSYQGGPPEDWPSPSWDSEFVSWSHTPSPSDGAMLVTGLRGEALAAGLEAKYPRWLAVRSNGTTDLVSVPWAWWGALREDDEAIQFFYDRIRPSPVQPDQPGRLRVTVRDRRWFGLLEYLGAGRLDRAAQLLEPAIANEDPEEMTASPESALYGKTKSPLVATAGAFILIADAMSEEPQYWDRWLDNLARWFPGIPDGAILLCCRRAEQARDPAQLEAAFTQISDGIDRGIPFFAATMRLASVTLARMSDTVAGAGDAMRTIVGVSSRVDSDQPFTVIRLR